MSLAPPGGGAVSTQQQFELDVLSVSSVDVRDRSGSLQEFPQAVWGFMALCLLKRAIYGRSCQDTMKNRRLPPRVPSILI